MLTEKCTFPKGAIILVVDGDDEVRTIVREFLLEEEQMGHTFLVMNDMDLDRARLADDSSYYSAALMAARVKIAGVKVTPEIILELHPDDGRYLLGKAALLEERGDEFRKEIEAAPEGHPLSVKTGLQGG